MSCSKSMWTKYMLSQKANGLTRWSSVYAVMPPLQTVLTMVGAIGNHNLQHFV